VEAIQLAEQVVLMPPEADRRIFSRYREIPLCARDSALHWIATACPPHTAAEAAMARRRLEGRFAFRNDNA